MMELSRWNIYMILGLMSILSAQKCFGETDHRDILAINSLYAALGFPPLPGWLLAGGDPCGQGWQGVKCVISNITGIVLNDANLGGELGENLGAFPSIIEIDLRNNHIGGRIPSNLPPTVNTLFLSGNQLTGSIPDSLSMLGQLTDLSLNNNHLAGVIPDSFQQLSGLLSLDLSANNLSGQLPPSMANLSSLTSLNLQDNHLTGVLDVLRDLPLINLDVENNLFSGPIPSRLLSIPNFRSTGNPFNTTVIPSPPAGSSPPPSSTFEALPPEIGPGIQVFGQFPPPPPSSSSKLKSLTSNKLVWVAAAGILILVAGILGICICRSRRRGEKSTVKASKRSRADAFCARTKNSTLDVSSPKPSDHRTNDSKSKEDHTIDMTKTESNSFIRPQLLPREGVVVKPAAIPATTRDCTSRNVNSATSFSIASLQQYTNSFSEENLVGNGTLGAVYRAKLPNGKLLAVKKLDDAIARRWSDKDFVGLVSDVVKLRNENVVPLVGYCGEHGQRLFVHDYCSNGSLHDALHLDDAVHEKLSWNARLHLALQAARALEYLHEVCRPPVVHRNFKSANVLLDEELNARISDCGLGPVLPASHIGQLQGLGYGGPELESGSYTYQSDVYSFGVVMLELLTGRKAYDRSRPRGEQFLVRWAIPRFHDIEALSRMVDPSLRAACSSKSLSRFADIISLCVQPEPEFRPPMSEIVQSLLYMIQRNA